MCHFFAKHCAAVLGSAMPSTLDVDPEWGTSLIGVRLSIPDSWWDGFSGNGKNLATLTDFEKGESPGDLCRMAAWRTGHGTAACGTAADETVAGGTAVWWTGRSRTGRPRAGRTRTSRSRTSPTRTPRTGRLRTPRTGRPRTARPRPSAGRTHGRSAIAVDELRTSRTRTPRAGWRRRPHGRSAA